MIYQRILAILILCIPGATGVYGWTLLRDVFFDYVAGEGFQWGWFILGTLLFLGGLAFVGGFLFYRDAKRNQVQPMLLRKKKKRKPAPGDQPEA
ncbi:DUF2627 family protein [Desmospora profundinema]|uniref:DUF2627 domain-containing protein n=1 Tax=Desmospora profundinema TaxID=1571184 RepID=A0ABU1IJA4_9BACL|nr:DUF2627 family protein [Desmospora profundinema]MDR6224617.1 hypothetical protein [Desmospora profundinema]